MLYNLIGSKAKEEDNIIKDILFWQPPPPWQKLAKECESWNKCIVYIIKTT